MTEEEEVGRSLRGLLPEVGRAFFGDFKVLRPGQVEAIPMVLSGSDTVVIAGTGSGKTEAMLAPLVSSRLDGCRSSPRPVIAYVAPTRALVNDIFRRIDGPLSQLGVRAGIRHGERNDLDRVNKPQVIVTTPESLDVLISRNADLLAALSAVVIDEAHQLYNTERGMQLAIVLRRIELRHKRALQVVAASATVADPAQLWAFFRPGAMPRVSQDRTHRPIDNQIRLGLDRDEVCALIASAFDGMPVKILAFAVSRRECDALADTTRTIGGFGESVYAHHSTLSKAERSNVESAFLSSSRAICFATSTLELGIDIGDIDLVVLWGNATGWESITQRIGRGNRRRPHTNVLCVTPREDGQSLASRLGYQAVFRQIARQEFFPGEAVEIYGAAAQQMVAMATSPGRGFISLTEFRQLLEPWPHLDAAATTALSEALVEAEYLKPHPVTNSLGADEKAHELVQTRQAWSNLPISSRTIEIRDGGHVVGTVPANNQVSLAEGEVFILSGRRFQVLSMGWDHVNVRSSSKGPTVSIKYEGGRPSVDPGLVESAWALLTEDPSTGVYPEAASMELRLELASLCHAASHLQIPCCEVDDGFAYVTFAGAGLNRLIPRFFGSEARILDDSILVSEVPLSFESLPIDLAEFGPLLEQFAAYEAAESIFQKLLPAELKRREILSTWRRYGANSHILRRLTQSSLVHTPEVREFARLLSARGARAK